MSQYKFTLTSYEPVYAVAKEVKIPESEVRAQALKWMEANWCKEGESAKLTDQFVASHAREDEKDALKTVDDVLVFIRYNMYKDNREAQQLSDQDAVCAVLADRLVEELPQQLIDESIYAARMRIDDAFRRSGITAEDYCKHNNITEEQLLKDVDARAIQSLREDSALQAVVDHENFTLEAEDFYAIIPGNSIEEKAYKRRQIEADGRLAGMEEYALKTKALKFVMDNAMVKRCDDPNVEYVRYGDVSQEVQTAAMQHPEAFGL